MSMKYERKNIKIKKLECKNGKCSYNKTSIWKVFNIIKGFLYFFTNTCTLHIIQDQTIPKKIHHDKHFILS